MFRYSCRARTTIPATASANSHRGALKTTSSTTGISTTAVRTRFIWYEGVRENEDVAVRRWQLDHSSPRNGVRVFEIPGWPQAGGCRENPAIVFWLRKSRHRPPATKENCSNASRRWCGSPDQVPAGSSYRDAG